MTVRGLWKYVGLTEGEYNTRAVLFAFLWRIYRYTYVQAPPESTSFNIPEIKCDDLRIP